MEKAISACFYDDIKTFMKLNKNEICRGSNEIKLINYAATCGSIQIVRYLIENNSPLTGTLIDIMNPNVSTNRFELCKLLLENGADPNMHRIYNPFYTPLHAVCFLPLRSLNVCKLLLSYGADVTPVFHTSIYCINPLDRMWIIQNGNEYKELYEKKKYELLLFEYVKICKRVFAVQTHISKQICSYMKLSDDQINAFGHVPTFEEINNTIP